MMIDYLVDMDTFNVCLLEIAGRPGEFDNISSHHQETFQEIGRTWLFTI